MAAAPHLFDDSLIASPELALVDVDLAAQLREGIRTGEEFRPRTVARPEFRLLQPVELPDELGAADVVVDGVGGLPEHEDAVVEVEPVVASLEVESEPVPPVIDEVLELPDDVVGEEPAAAVDAVDELPEYVVADDEVVIDVEPVMVALEVAPAAPVLHEPSELPDYVVAPEEPADVVETQPAVLDLVAEPLPFEVTASDLPDYIVRADEQVLGDLVAEEPSASDYPVLPDLGEASEALEETDVALRRIREQLASEEASHRRRRLRRGFIAASGVGAVAALAMVAVDVQMGVRVLGF